MTSDSCGRRLVMVFDAVKERFAGVALTRIHKPEDPGRDALNRICRYRTTTSA